MFKYSVSVTELYWHKIINNIANTNVIFIVQQINIGISYIIQTRLFKIKIRKHILPRDTKEDINLSISFNFQCLQEASFQRSCFGSLLTKELACVMTNDERYKQRSF